jgi:hypothetical protein
MNRLQHLLTRATPTNLNINQDSAISPHLNTLHNLERNRLAINLVQAQVARQRTCSAPRGRSSIAGLINLVRMRCFILPPLSSLPSRT